MSDADLGTGKWFSDICDGMDYHSGYKKLRACLCMSTPSASSNMSTPSSALAPHAQFLTEDLPRLRENVKLDVDRKLRIVLIF